MSLLRMGVGRKRRRAAAEPPADYIVAEGEWASFWTTHGGLETAGTKEDVSGKVIEVRGDQTNAKLGALAVNGPTITFSSEVMIRGRKDGGGERVVFLGGLEGGGLSKIRFQNIDFYQNTPTKNVITIHRGCTDFTVEDFVFRGPGGFDLLGDYSTPEAYAALIASMAGNGISGAGGSAVNGLYLRRGRMENLQNGIKHGVRGKWSLIEDVHGSRILSDFIGIGTMVEDPMAGLTVRFCTSELLFANSGMNGGPPNNPHSDHFQWQGSNIAALQKNIRIEACVFWVNSALSAGGAQNVFISDFLPAWGPQGCHVSHSIFVIPDMGSAGVVMSYPQSCSAYKVACVREHPGLGSGGNAISFTSSTGDTIAVDCAVEGINTPASQGVTVLGNNLANYQAYWSNISDFSLTSVQDIIDKYGAHPMFAAVDWEARTIDYASEKPCVVFQDVFGAEPETEHRSNWTMIKHGPQEILVEAGPGVAFELADDPEGGGLTGPHSSATTTRGKYIRMVATSSAEAVTEVASTVTINGYACTWNVTTKPEMEYAVTRFTDSKLTIAPKALTTSDTKKLMAHHAWKPVARPTVSSMYIWGQANTGIGLQHQPNGHLRFTLRDPTGAICANADFYTGSVAWEANWAEMFITVDMTAASFDEGVVMWWNGARLTNHSAATWVQGADIRWHSSTTEFRYGQGNNGANLYNHDLRMFYLNCEAVLDITQAEHRMKFSRDLIGADGSGPTGSASLICLMGVAADLNAGTGNKGYGGAMTKGGAGTITDV